MRRRVLWLIGVVEAVAALVVGWTWGAVPWTWSFPAFYVGLAFVLELTVRLRNVHVESALQALVLGGTSSFVFRGFFGERWTEGRAPLHLGALAIGSVMVGLGLAMWLRPRAAKQPT